MRHWDIPLKQRTNYLWIVIFLSLWSLTSFAETRNDRQTWLNVTAIGTFHTDNQNNKHLRYWLEGQERIGDDMTHSTQTLIRPGLGYAVTDNLSLWVGYAWIHSSLPLTTSPFNEDRIWQQMLWVKPFKSFILTSRTRLEERFFQNNPKTNYRARQLVKIAIPIKSHPKFSLVSSDEIFIHRNHFIGNDSRGIDQNRIFAGFSYKISSLATTEIGYMNQYIRRFGSPNFCANIVSLNLFLSL